MLTDAQKKKLGAFLDSRWKKGPACQLCQVNAWDVEGIINITTANEVGNIFGGPILPTAALVCRNCGHTVLINLIVADVIPKSQPPASSPDTVPA